MSPDAPSRPSELEALFLRFGTLAGSAAGTVGFVYLVGGAIMWLRFWRSDLPADQALALVPRTDLLVVGMRVMILPALAAGLLFLLLAARRSRRGEGTPLGRTTLVLLAVPAVVLALVVPFAPGAYAWPLAALGLWSVWCRCMPTERGARTLIWRTAVAAMLAAALVSIARQFDRPVKLPSATLMLTDERRPVTGVLVTASSDAVTIGFPESRRLTSFPRDQVATVDIGPPLDRRSPQRSLLSMAFGGEAWAATPLELWCGGESYGWTDLDALCRTQPRVASPLGEYADGRASVAVACPPEAARGCSGFLTVITSQAFALDDLARAAPVELGRTIYQLERDTTLEVSLPVAVALRPCLGSVEQPVPLRAILSSDRSGLGTLNGETGERVAIRFPRRSAERCGDQRPEPAGGNDDPGPGDGSPGGGGGDGDAGGETGSGGSGGEGDGDTGNTGDVSEGETSGEDTEGGGVENLPAEPPAADDPVVVAPEDGT
jgi:hypothetical protein